MQCHGGRIVEDELDAHVILTIPEEVNRLAKWYCDPGEPDVASLAWLRDSITAGRQLPITNKPIVPLTGPGGMWAYRFLVY